VRAYVGRDPVTGRKKYLTRTFKGGKRATEQALTKFVVEVGGGGHGSQDATVSDLIDRWLDLITPERSPTTARGYRWIADSYIVPTLGKVPLSRLKPAQLDSFYGHLRDKGGAKGQPLAAASVRQVHAILRTALNQAVKWGWLASNPALQATPPRLRRTEIVPPEPKDVLRLITEADSDDPDLAAFLRTSVTTGARRGELCALRWNNVDLGGKTLTIAHNLVEGKDGVLGGWCLMSCPGR
jgi:integrase